jgi:arylsulfatase
LPEARRSILPVLTVALAVRLLTLWAAAEATPLLDERTYALRAEALLDGRGFLGSYQSWVHHDDGRRPAELPQYPGAWQPPGQTAFMAAVLAVSGRSWLAVKLAQVLLGTLSVALVYALGRIWIDDRSGRTAAWIAALYPNLVAFTHYLFSETLFIFLLLLAVWLLEARRELPGWGRTLAGGLVFGLGLLTRATLLWFLPLWMAWFAWARRPHWREAGARAALAGLVALLVIVPWSVRNTRLHDGFVLLETNGSYNLWRGNGPDALVWRYLPNVPSYAWPFGAIPLAPVGNRNARRLVDEAREALAKPAPSDLEIVRHANAVALQSIRDEPGTFLARMPVKLLDLWNPTSFLLRHYRVGAYGPVHPLVQLTVKAAAVLAYLLVVGLACVGFWMLRRRPVAWLALLFGLYLSTVSAVAFGLTRFRLPLMPFLMILAAPPLLALVDRRRRRRAAALAAAAVALVGCGAPRPELTGHPNLVIVTLDTTRADHLGFYGYFRDTSPRFDALAADSIVFDRAIAPMATTLPTHVSLFTGAYPLEHGVLANVMHGGRRFVPAAGLRSFASVAGEAGYRTAAFVSAAPLKRDSGIDAGFEVFDEPAPTASQRPGPDTTDAVLAWLDQQGPVPFLLWVHYFDAHWPHQLPEPFDVRFETDADLERWLRERRVADVAWRGGRQRVEARPLANVYDTELRYQDVQLGRLLDALQARPDWERTAVLVVADHGEGLNQHDQPAHGESWDEQVRAAFLVRAPGHAPRRVSQTVSLVDALPTLLGLVEAPALAGFLEQVSGGDALAPDDSPRLAFSQDTGRDRGTDRYRIALTGDRWKYFQIHTGEAQREELYDLSADPFELHDVLDAQPEAAETLRRAMAEHLSAQKRRRAELGGGTQAPRSAADPEIVEQLRALGYVDAPGESGEAPSPLP